MLRSQILEIVLQPDGKILVGGGFGSIQSGGVRGRIVRLNSNGTEDTTFNTNPGVNSPPLSALIRDIILQPNEQVLIAGNFNAYNNITKLGLAHLNSDGSLDLNFNVASYQSRGSVDKIVVQADNKIVVGGIFTSVNGISRVSLTRINPNGSLDSSFTPIEGIPSTSSSAIEAIVLQPDGKILIGGNFFAINGITRNRIARLNSDGTLDVTFSAGDTFAGSGSVKAIGLQEDGKIVVAGFGVGPGGGLRGVVRLESNGNPDNTFASPQAFYTEMVLQSDGKVLVVDNNNLQNRIARLNSNGSPDTSFSATANTVIPIIQSIILQPDGKILVSGLAFKTIARLNTNGSLDTSFNQGTGVNNLIDSMALQSDGKIWIGGGFTSYNQIPRSNLARLNSDGSLDLTLNPDVRGGVQGDFIREIKLQVDGKVLIGGSFYFINDVGSAGIVRVIGDINTRRTIFDFDGDNKADISIFRPSNGQWWINHSSNGNTVAYQFGTSTDKPVPADYDGDGKTDVAFWRPSTGEWFVLRSSNLTFFSAPFGASTDIPAPGDFDGDGKADLTVFRPSQATWYINKTTGSVQITQFGANGDVPTVADYDADGKADIAIYRPTGGSGQSEWWILRSTAGLFATPFGTSTDKPVQGNYTGDGKADIAFWRPSTGEWFILRSEDLSFYAAPFGANSDIPVAGDYDGDGKFDLAVFRPSNATWFVLKTTGGTLIQGFGLTDDIPTPSAFVP